MFKLLTETLFLHSSGDINGDIEFNTFFVALKKIKIVKLAEGAGFEPAIRFPAYTLSKRAPSATRPPLRKT